MGIEVAVGAMFGLAKAGSSIAAGQANANAQRQQIAFQRQMNAVNNEILELDKEAAKDAGNDQLKQISQTARAIAGAQQVAFAAQGIDISSGSAADIQADTRYLAEIDAVQSKNNAMRAAFGFKTEQIQNNLQTEFNAMAGEQRAKQSIVGGWMGAAGDLVGAAGSAIAYKQQFGKPSVPTPSAHRMWKD